MNTIGVSVNLGEVISKQVLRLVNLRSAQTLFVIHARTTITLVKSVAGLSTGKINKMEVYVIKILNLTIKVFVMTVLNY